MMPRLWQEAAHSALMVRQLLTLGPIGRHGALGATVCVSTRPPKSFTPQTLLKPGIIHQRTGVNWGFQGMFPGVGRVKSAEL